ncbi:MAG: tetratricopeptide repeat protein [Ignavibacteriae bacterium]|nr:tetratricopeptide repeat protein [Ignavibacteriota bacterium]
MNNKFYAAEAKAAFDRAIELDSNFAMAYFQLATVNLGSLTTEEFTSAMKKAYALSVNITERERLLIQSTYASAIEHDETKAISILENLLQKYPHEQAARNGLAFLYTQRAEFEKANAMFAKELESDSLDKTLWNSAAYSYAGLNRRREAMNAIDRYLQLAPAEPNPYDSKGDIYAMFDERDSAVIWWKKAIAFRPDFPSALKLVVDAFVRQDSADMEKYISKGAAAMHLDEKVFREEVFPLILMSHGQLTKARTECQKLLTSHRNKKQDVFIVGDIENIIVLDYEMCDYPAMVQHAQEYSTILRKDTATNPTYGRMTVAIAQTKNGNPQAVSNILEAVDRSSAGNIAARARYDYGSGIISFENGKYDAALEQMNTAFRAVPPHHAPFYHHAVCLLKSGNLSEALNELNRLTRWSPIRYTPYDLDGLPLASYWLIGLAKAHYWLGVAHEQQGEKEKAVTEYQKFLELWKDADFDSPEIKDAKQRLSKLQGITAK